MRELLLKNLTCLNKRRKILSWSEASFNDGVLTKVNRKFIYLVREQPQSAHLSEKPEFYIFKNHDSKSKQEKFIFKIKGNFYVTCDQKNYLVYYRHSLNIRLSEAHDEIIPQTS